MRSKKIKLYVKSILAAVLITVVCIGTTGCAEILQILEYLGDDFYFGDGSYNNFDENFGATVDSGSGYTKILPDVPDADFDGYDFTILADNKSYDETGRFNDIVASEETGEVINDSVYMRNIRTEEKYNIRIKGEFWDDAYTRARKAVMAGDDMYDLFALPMNMTAQSAAQGLMYNLTNVPYIDLSKPWWDENASQQLSIANKLYFTTGDLLISDKNASSVFLFNKRLVMDYGFESPYELVKQGKWTVDKMQEMAKSVPIDINGDGKMSKDHDMFGLLTSGEMLHGSVLSSGDFLVGKDKDDLPFVNMTERMLTSFNKWTDIYYDGTRTLMLGDSEEKLAVFNENRTLFMYDNMSLVPEMRGNEVDFGILPNPKSDATQESYRNAVNPSLASAVSIPVTNSNLDRTGIILETLTAESYYTLLPSYYNVMLNAKYYRDEDSAEMLDIIFATLSYDLGQIYNWGGINEMVKDVALNKKTDFVSEFEKNQSRIQKSIDKLIVMFEELN